MDRRIAFTYEVPYVEDFLYTSRYQMVALGKLLEAIVTTDIAIHGFNCIPNSPPDLDVIVEPGEVYKEENVDDNAYGSIPADTTRQIIKQGITWDDTQLTNPAPVTPGNSVKHLVQMTFAEEDTDAESRQFYDGTTEWVQTVDQVRLGKCIVELKTGVEAVTGTELPPVPDTGYAGAWVITVAYGQTTITAPDITEYADAPFIAHTIVDSASKQGVQRQSYSFAEDTGIADVYEAEFTPKITTYTDGLQVTVKIKNSNTGNSTLNGGDGAKQILDLSYSPLNAGDLTATHSYSFRLDLVADKWVALQTLDEVYALPPDYRSGCEYNQDAGDTANDIEIIPGKWRSSDDTINLVLGSALTKQIDAAWAEGDDAGGYAASVAIAADKPYHLFLIGKPNGITDAGYDDSITATNLLAAAASAGYTKYRRIGTVFTEYATTNIRDFIMTADGIIRIFYFYELTTDYYLKPVTDGAKLAELKTPPNIKVNAIFNVAMDMGLAVAEVYFSDPDQADQLPSLGGAVGTVSPSWNFAEYNDQVTGGRSIIRTNTSREVRYRPNADWSPNGTMSISTVGWEE